MKNKFSSDLLLMSFVAFSLQACFDQESLFGQESAEEAASTSYEGCLTGQSLGTNAARLTFEFPSFASEVQVYRNGILVFSSENSSAFEFIDAPLEEGNSYIYSCKALTSGAEPQLINGDNEIELTTDIINPPGFEGLKTTTQVGDRGVLLSWGATSGVTPSEFRIYQKLGSSDAGIFDSAPVAVVSSSFARQTLLEGMGDELQYHFAVRACTSTGICDDNTVTMDRTLSDAGAPVSPGVSAVRLVDGQAVMTAPWNHTHGGVSVRRILRYELSNTSAACPSNIGSYSEMNSIPFTDVDNPPTELTALGALLQNHKYCFVVRDTDPTGNISSNSAVRTLLTGDLTKPDFPSTLTFVRPGSGFDTNLRLSFTAIQNESQSALAGASVYEIYLASAAHPSLPSSDVCNEGQLIRSVSAASYASGSTVALNLGSYTTMQARRNYRACVRAVDSSNNVSTQEPQTIVLATGDATAPTFFGIQSLDYNASSGGYDVGVITSSSDDVRNYKITFERVRASVALADVVVTRTSAAAASSSDTFSILLSEAGIQEGDSITVKVDACDDASPNFNSSDNCTASTAGLTRLVPDTTPPPGFGGITNAVAGAGHAEITVSWLAPGDWTDYQGFNVYSVNGADIDLMQTCRCPLTSGSPDCINNPITSCTFSTDANGQQLVPYKTHTWHVRAFDAEGNITPLSYSGGGAVVATGQVNDAEAPDFSGSEFAGVLESGEVKLRFFPASDSQNADAPDSGTVTYKIYRKVDLVASNTAFDCPLTPDTGDGGCDGLTPIFTGEASDLVIESGKLVYTDTDLDDGQTHNYQVCAEDSSGNLGCQGVATAEVYVDDVTPPVVELVLLYRQVGAATGQFRVMASDNIDDLGDLRVNVTYREDGSFPSNATDGTQVLNNTVDALDGVTISSHRLDKGSDFVSLNPSDLSTSAGANASRWYRVAVRDAANNETLINFKDLLEAPTITTAVRTNTCAVDFSQASNASCKTPDDASGNGGDTIEITGTNFWSSTTVPNGPVAPDIFVGPYECASVTPVSDTVIRCTTPNADAGLYDIRILSWDQQEVTSSSAFRYNTYCDMRGSETPFSGGTGSTLDPYKICTPDQLDDVRNNLTASFRLMGEIDLDGFDFDPIPAITSEDFSLDGNGYAIKNWTHDEVGGTAHVGLVQSMTKGELKNILLDNVTLSSSSTGNYGALIGRISDDTIVSNITLQNSTLSNSTTNAGRGGLFGYVHHLDSPMSNLSLDNVDAVFGGGSWVGLIAGYSAGTMSTISVCSIKDSSLDNGAGRWNGGVAGSWTGTIENCRVDNFTVTAGRETAGLVGSTTGAVHNSTVVNSTITGTTYIGGAVGGAGVGMDIQDSAVANTDIVVNGANGFGGGLVGYAHTGNIERSGFSGTVDLTSSNIHSYGGGLIGGQIYTGTLSIKDAYARGSVDSLGGVGGFMGYEYTHASYPTRLSVDNVFVAVAVDTDSANIGGWVGRKLGPDPITFANNFWSNQAAVETSLGNGTYTSSPVDVGATANLKDQNTFTNWDFVGESTNGTDDIWVMSGDSATYGYKASGFPVIANVTPVFCPPNFTYVPANDTLGVPEFCVAQFEMKDVSGTPTSQAAGLPIIGLNTPSSEAACQGLGSGFDLITNLQWNAVARNVASVDSNWSNGAVGDGVLARGAASGTWSEGWFVSAVSDDSNPCGSASSCAFEARRAMVLSTGEWIWDLAGNATEIVKYRSGSLYAAGSASMTSEETEPLGGFAAGNNYGAQLADSAGTSTYILRGLATVWFGGDADRGAFSWHHRNSGWAGFDEVGYRCVFNPAPTP